MDAFLSACMRLYDMAFPGESEQFTRAMFDRYAPELQASRNPGRGVLVFVCDRTGRSNRRGFDIPENH